MKSRIALVVISGLVSGCALTPSQVSTPPHVALKDDKGAAIQNPWVAELGKVQSAGKGSTRIPLTTDKENLQAQLEVYSAFWLGAEGNYLLSRDIAGRARDLAVLAAAYYAIQSHLKEARYAGIFGAIFGTASDTYKVETQAKNYQIAASAMSCISQAIDKVPTAAWTKFNADGSFNALGILPGTASEVQASMKTLNDVFPAVNRTMNRVLARLMKDQRELKLSGVNLESLRAAYDNEREARDKATKQGEQRVALIPSNFGEDQRSKASSDIATDVAHIAAVTALPADAEKCYGSSGS
jgi:hypothetical protein